MNDPSTTSLTVAIISALIVLGVPVGLLTFLVYTLGNWQRVGGGVQSPVETLPPLETLEAREATPGTGSVLQVTFWESLRVGGVFLVFVAILGLSLALFWPLYPLATRLPLEYDRVDLLVQGSVCGVAVVLLVVGLLLTWWTSRRLFGPLQEADGAASRKWLVVSVGAAAIACVGQFLSFSTAILGFAMLFAVVPMWFLTYCAKRYRGVTYAAVAIAFLMVFAPLGASRMYLGHLGRQMAQREVVFQTVLDEAGGLFKHEDFLKAISNPVSGPADHQDSGGVVVLDAVTKDKGQTYGLTMSPLGLLMAPDGRANEVAAVRKVVIVGPPGEDVSPVGLFAPINLPGMKKKLMCPILVYRWPDKKLVRSGKLLTSREFTVEETADRDFVAKLLPDFAASLERFLRE